MIPISAYERILCAAALAAAITVSDAAVRVLPGLNNFFQHAETGLPTEIPQIDETFAPAAPDAIADWIATRFLRDK